MPRDPHLPAAETGPSAARLWAVGAAAATVLGVAYAAQAVGLHLARDQPPEVARTLAVQLLPWYAWAFLLPAVYRFCARWPLTGGGARRNAWRHAAAAVAAPAVHTLLVFIPTALLRGWTADGVPPWVAFQLVFANAAAADVAHFALLVAGCHAVIAARGAAERELRAARLEARLAQAELHALRAQLEPHFLFNTLNAVAASLRDDPEAAETMLERLGGLLRLVLQGRGEQEVTLGSEIDFVRRYLDIHQARFGGRLRVTWSVDPELEHAYVPALLLQPLAENAVRHGVAARPGAGWIEVAAEHDGARLRLRVRDDGAGPAAAWADGVGLANTRARLAQLYGAGQRLTVAPRQPAGTEVEVTLPLRFGAGG